MSDTFPWAFVIIGGPVLLGLLLAWATVRTGRRNKRIDPTTPSDDPSQGMTGHDVAEPERRSEPQHRL